MKTKITCLLVLVASVFSLSAQIPNASFENWTGNEPDHWITYNIPFSGLVTQVTDAHAGSKAVKLNVINFAGSNLGGSMISGDNANNTFFPVSSPPVALHGWYKFHPTVGSEEIVFTGLVKSIGSYTGSAAGSVSTNTAVYIEFIINFNYITTVADSVSLYMSLSDPDSVRSGTYAIVDDLSFGPAGPSGVDELTSNNLLEPCSPNPVSQVANIIYRVTGSSKVSVTLFDVIGHKVKTLLDGESQNSGRYKIPTDVSDLVDGIYFCRLDVNGQSYTQKLVVSRSNR